MFNRNLVMICITSFAVGGAIEIFMIKTGFYTIVGQKEAERRLGRETENKKMVERMKKLNIKFDDIIKPEK